MAAPSYRRTPVSHQETPQYDTQQCMLVIDPVSRKLVIPYEYISPTLARHRQGVPSLCMLFFNGRCRQGPNCHQVHADPNVVLTLRSQAQKKLMCCKNHGDEASLEPSYVDKYVLIFTGGSGNSIPMEKVAMTQGLHRSIDEFEQQHPEVVGTSDEVTMNLSVTTICRLHGQERCKFGAECKFVHLCKELLWSEVSLVAGMPTHPAGVQARRFSNYSNQPPSPYHSDHCQHTPPYSSNYARGYYQPPATHMSCESLISMDLTATPPLTPTSDPMVSPVIKCKQAGDSWSYEPYGFNPIPPALEFE